MPRHQGVADADDDPVLPCQYIWPHEPALVEPKMAAKLLLNVNQIIVGERSISTMKI